MLKNWVVFAFGRNRKGDTWKGTVILDIGLFIDRALGSDKLSMINQWGRDKDYLCDCRKKWLTT